MPCQGQSWKDEAVTGGKLGVTAETPPVAESDSSVWALPARTDLARVLFPYVKLSCP